jgi:subtilase family serine protease
VRVARFRSRSARRVAVAAACAVASLLAPGVAGATAVGRAAQPRAQRLQLVFPLVADDAALRRYTAQVTNPKSPLYEQYRSIAWLAHRFGASAGTEARVAGYLRSHGAADVKVDVTGLFIDATMGEARAERLFSTNLREFRTDLGTRYTAPASAVAVPAGLRGLITGVVGLDTEPVAAAPALVHASSTSASAGSSAAAASPVLSDRLEPEQTTATETSSGYDPVSGTVGGCSAGQAAGGFTPNQYMTAYDYSPLQTAGTLGQGERVALIEIDGFRASDITTFAQCFGFAVPRINAFGVGVRHALSPGGEATLDLEVLDAAAPDLQSIDVYESQPEASNVLMALTAPLQSTGYKPQVISASLGLCEAQTLQAVGHSGINSTEAALEEAADSGISFLAASGDYGSADCASSNSSQAVPDPQLAVNYPASSPYVTGVGGTNLVLTSANTIQSSSVWNDAGAITPVAAGGGGFSTLFARPSYQTGTVVENQRTVPDVALLADVAPGYDVYCSAAPDCINQQQTSGWQTVGGTSAATPLLAGGLALIDQLLRVHQQAGLGLVNPLLYQIGRNATEAAVVYYGIASGSNDVGPFIQADGQPLGCCTAVAGYNAVTGWGGIDLQQLSTAALQAEPAIANVSVTVPGGQRPVSAKHILATVTCSSSCLFTAYARVTIGTGVPFTNNAALFHLDKPGTKTVKINFTTGQLKRLAAAVKAGTKVTATVTGAIVDPAYNIERQSPQGHLTITG